MEKAFADMKAANCEIVYVLADPIRPTVPPLAAKYGLPSVYQVNSYPKLGGLMSYGPDIQSLFIGAAHYVDRILKGGSPADMPIEQPTNFFRHQPADRQSDEPDYSRASAADGGRSYRIAADVVKCSSERSPDFRKRRRP